MSDIIFSVRSDSTGELYSLKAIRTNSGVRFACSCPAGEQGQACKHRMALIVGDVTSVVDVDVNAVTRLVELISSSPISQALELVARAEVEFVASKRKLSAAKKALGRAMMG